MLVLAKVLSVVFLKVFVFTKYFLSIHNTVFSWPTKVFPYKQVARVAQHNATFQNVLDVIEK